jgi:hypothetical protein
MEEYAYDKAVRFARLPRVLKAIARGISLAPGAADQWAMRLGAASWTGRPGDAEGLSKAAHIMAGVAATSAKAELLNHNFTFQCEGCQAVFRPKSINLNLADGSFETDGKGGSSRRCRSARCVGGITPEFV